MDYKVLICEDTKDISEPIESSLINEGYHVKCVDNGFDAINAVKEGDIHLVIMDIMLIEKGGVSDGLVAAKEIRKFSNVPILFLSAKGTEIDKIRGLSVGGDDYVAKNNTEPADDFISKPFSMLELLARVKSIRRRYTCLGGIGGIPKTVQEKNVYCTGELVLDDNKKRVSIAGKDKSLTKTEYLILRTLMINMDNVLSGDQIYELVWEEAPFSGSTPIGVHISHIRSKIEENPKEPLYLQTSYGLGYKVVKRD